MTTQDSLMEKRNHSRFEVDIPVQYRIVDSQTFEVGEKFSYLSGFAKDMSLDGLFLETDKALETGCVFRLNISLVEESKQLFAFAEVVWSGSHGAGLRLMMMSVEDEEDFKKYLSKMAQHAGK